MQKVWDLRFYYDGANEVIDYGIFQYNMNLAEITELIAAMPEYIIDNVKQKMQALEESLKSAPRIYNYDKIYPETRESRNILSMCYKSICEQMTSLPQDYMHVLFFFPLIKAIMEMRALYGYSFAVERLPKWHQVDSPSLMDSIKASLLDFLFFFIPKRRISDNEEIFQNLESLYSTFLGLENILRYPNAPHPVLDSISASFFKYLEDCKINSWLDTFTFCVSAIITNCDEVLQVKESALRFFDEDTLPAESTLIRSEMELFRDNNIPSIKQIHFSELYTLSMQNHNALAAEIEACDTISEELDLLVPDALNAEVEAYDATLEESDGLTSNDLQNLYTQKNNSYGAWCNRNIDMLRSYTNPDFKEIIEDIIQEIYTIRSRWQTSCKAIQCDYELRKINAKTAIESIKPPPIEERSPLLFQYSDKLKERK